MDYLDDFHLLVDSRCLLTFELKNHAKSSEDVIETLFPQFCYQIFQCRYEPRQDRMLHVSGAASS
jgi:hypothetical protein